MIFKDMIGSIGCGIGKACKFVWGWTIISKSGNSLADEDYAAVWRTLLDKENVLNVLHPHFSDIARDELPFEEESLRQLLKKHFLLPDNGQSTNNTDSDSDNSTVIPVNEVELESQRQKLLLEVPEECWEHIPENIQNLLAAFNIQHVEQKLLRIAQEDFHCMSGLGSINRARSGVRKTFRIYREGFSAGVSRMEWYFVQFFFVFLAFSACYPDVAAGFLGERSYNQRSIGSRIVTLFQLFFIWRYPHHSGWLLFNWSLERLLGAFVGNTVYALVAIFPVIHTAYGKNWFRLMILAMSLCWQITVQFSPTVRDYLVRLLTRRQMIGLRGRAEHGNVDWETADKAVEWELQTLKSYTARHVAMEDKSSSCHDVPIRVRIERFIQFTSRFKLGRPADQAVGLLKDDFESVIETLEDYRSTSPAVKDAKSHEKGHVEPQAPKFILVVFDLCIFAYVCYSFFPQPFTFNTVVAYGTVVTIKQTIVAFKRYQTPKSARRVFTNMVSINVIGMLLVSTPVTIDRQVLENDTNFILLTLAMVFATIFLAEPIAPVMLRLVEGIVTVWTTVLNRFCFSEKEEASQPEKSIKH